MTSYETECSILLFLSFYSLLRVVHVMDFLCVQVCPKLEVCWLYLDLKSFPVMPMYAAFLLVFFVG